MKYNFRSDLHDHFNHLRTFALNDEAGLLMATYPKGRRPSQPFPYYNEVMTGFEYSAAIGMLYYGETTEGLKCIEAIRNRYDGRKRNPFNEAECGHHYARAMIAWAGLLALSGFQYSAVSKSMSMLRTSVPVRFFWSNGYAWGSIIQKPRPRATEITLSVCEGNLALRNFSLTTNEGGADTTRWTREHRLRSGKSLTFKVAPTCSPCIPVTS